MLPARGPFVANTNGVFGFQMAADIPVVDEGVETFVHGQSPNAQPSGFLLGYRLQFPGTMAEEKGMEVSDAVFDLSEARNQLVKSRAYVHTFSPAVVKEITDGGIAIAKKAFSEGKSAMAEFYFRRRGLFASLGVILLLIAALWLKIRRLEK